MRRTCLRPRARLRISARWIPVADSQYNVDNTGKGIFFIDADMFNGGICLGHPRCECGNKSALWGDLYFELYGELAAHSCSTRSAAYTFLDCCESPSDCDRILDGSPGLYPARYDLQLGRRDRVTAARVLQQQAIRGVDNDWQCRSFALFAELAFCGGTRQVGHRKGHAIAEADLLQDIFKCRGAGLFKQAFDLRFFELFVASAQTAEGLVEQALAEINGFVVLLMFKEVTNGTAGLCTDHKV